MEKYKDLVGLAEVAEMVGVSKSCLSNWRRRNVKLVPEPMVVLALGPIWNKSVIEKWIKKDLK